MSQAKVEQYKKDKANRKKIMRKEKLQSFAGRACAWLILLAIVGWAGYSGISYYLSKQPTKTIYADLTSVTDYLNSLNPADTEEE